MWSTRALTVAVSFCLATPTLAQGVPPAEETIEVVGKREQDRRRTINAFVRALSREPTTEPITRFDTACPEVAGLSPAQNQAIIQRMRVVAGAAAVPLAKPGCRPNVLVIVVPDKNEMLKALRKRHPDLFRDGRRKIINIVRDDSAALAWHISVDVDREGQPLASSNGIPVVETDVPNRYYSAFRPVSIGGIVLLEQAGIVGLTTTQIADYATMRAFSTAEPRQLSQTNAPTILRLLDSKIGDETPLSLTSWDLAFLKAAYAVSAGPPC